MAKQKKDSPDIIEFFETADRIDNYVKEVEKAEKDVGWKDGKLYNKEGELICEHCTKVSKKND